MLTPCTSTLALEGLKRHLLCPRHHMEDEFFDGDLMVDGDVTWFDGKRDTWHAVEHLVAGHMAFGGPTIFTKGLNISLGGLTSPFRAWHHP
jgi:hypothetical protein